jgi:phage terminase large subunit-like protein
MKSAKRKQTNALYADGDLTAAQLEVREIAMADLGAFAALVVPKRVFAHCHKDLMRYMCQEDPNQLILWPRAHQKSTAAAIWASWYIVNHPDITMLYASATADLAKLQLSYIKMILDSDIVHKYWPELIKQSLMERTKWTEDRIAVDHPKRFEEAIRDMTVRAIGIGGTATGQHYDIVLLDDLVDQDNSETLTSRKQVSNWFSYLASIINDAGMTKAVGTRYHPKDLYSEMMEMTEDVYNERGEVIDTVPLFTVSQKVVEVDGQFLWPRQQRDDGKWFGFDFKVLASKKAKYRSNLSGFYSQYYNDPTDPETKRIEGFEYYDESRLSFRGAYWYYNGNRLNVYAAIDFAATVNKRSDYTSIVVLGVDGFQNYYVLDIDRFKTDKISEMQTHLKRLYSKWFWKKLRAEATGQQNLVVEQIKADNKRDGIRYHIDKVTSLTTEKRVRINTNLEPIYADQRMLHRRGGFWEILEYELSSDKAAHDDIADVLSSAVEIAVAPVNTTHLTEKAAAPITYNRKFGGVA